MCTESKIFVADTRKILSTIEPTYSELKIRGKIPASANARPLSESYYDPIVNLHRSVFPHNEFEIAQRLENKSANINYCSKASLVILDNHDVIGTTLVLTRKHEDLAYVYVIIVDSRYRNMWCTVYTKYHSAKHLLSSGINRVAFQVLNSNLDTTKLVYKVNAILLNDLNWSGL